MTADAEIEVAASLFHDAFSSVEVSRRVESLVAVVAHARPDTDKQHIWANPLQAFRLFQALQGNSRQRPLCAASHCGLRMDQRLEADPWHDSSETTAIIM